MYNFSFYKTSFWILLFMLSLMEVSGQENPPIPIEVEVRTSRNLNFGSFVAGNSIGYVTVDYNGIRTVDGDIVGLSVGEVSTALFDVYANSGTIIQIQQMGDTELTNGNGGTIYLSLDSFSTGQRTFVTWEQSAQIPNEVSVGGTLTIPADNSGNLPGRYNGTFTLNFIHQ